MTASLKTTKKVLFSSMVMVAISLLAAAEARAQTAADNRGSVYSTAEEEEKRHRPRSIQETILKMKIEKDVKDFERMIDRGEEAVKIAEELEAAMDEHGRLTEKEMSKLAAVEKLARQIRKDLGGADDEKNEQPRPQDSGFDLTNAVKSLRSSAEDLFGELKKTTRFTISAGAIQSSNAILRIARLLRVAN
jgi:hypothetical protein